MAPGTPIWVQHKQNATWETAVVVNQCASYSYWIIQENGALQPKTYRHTRTFLKIKSTPIDGEAKAQMKEWQAELENVMLRVPVILYGTGDFTVKNSQLRSSSSSLAMPLSTLDLPNTQIFSEMKEEDSQHVESLCTSGPTLENAPSAPIAPVQHKSTRENFGKPTKKYSDQLYL